MERQRGELVPIAEALADLPGPTQALIPSPPTQRHFTRADQVNQLVSASEADPDLGFMARLMSDLEFVRIFGQDARVVALIDSHDQASGS